MNIWIITVTFLLHITPCYLQQKTGWWSGQASPSTSHNSRTPTSGSHPGGQVVNPAWNQAPKSWPNTEPSGWSASQKRQVTVKPRNMNGPPSSRHRPQSTGRPRPGEKNGARNYNWKPSVYRYQQGKKPASPKWSVKSGTPTWKAPGMHHAQPPKRKWGNSWGQNSAPGHQVKKDPKPHDFVKGWSTTGTQSLWTDQGNPKNAPASTSQPQIPAWAKKRPATPTSHRANKGKAFHSNGPRRPPYPQRRTGYTPKPYPPKGYTPKPFPRTAYTPKPYHRASGNPHERHPPRKPEPESRYQNDKRQHSPNRPRDTPSRNPQYHGEPPVNKVTLPPPQRRHEEVTGFSTPPRFDSPKPRDPVTASRRSRRPETRTSSWAEPSSPKTAHGGRFEPSRGETFHRAEPKRVDTFNHNKPRRKETVPPRKSSHRRTDFPKERQQSNSFQPNEPTPRKTDPRKERTRSKPFTDIEPSRSNSVYRKIETAHIDPPPPSPNVIDIHEPLPSEQPNRISNTPKTDQAHLSDVASSHKDPTHSDTFLHMDARESNAITPTETGYVEQHTQTEPTHSTTIAQTEPVIIESHTREQKPTPKEELLGIEAYTTQTVMLETATSPTTTDILHISDITDKTNTPIPQESVQIAVDIQPINPTKAAEPEYKRDPITEKIIAELKRKLKIMSSPNYRKSTSDNPDGNASVSVLEVMQQQQKPSTDPQKETGASKAKENSVAKDSHHVPASQPKHDRKSNSKTRTLPNGHQERRRSRKRNEPNPDITEVSHTENLPPKKRTSPSHASRSDYQPDHARNTDIHYEEVVESRRTKSRRIPDTFETPQRERTHRQSKSHQKERHLDRHGMDRNGNEEPAHHGGYLPEEIVKPPRRKADIHEVGYYEGVTDVRQHPTSHPDDLRHPPRTARRRVDRHRNTNDRMPARGTAEPTIEFIGEPNIDDRRARKTGRKRHLPDPRPAPISPHDSIAPGKQHEPPGELLSVYDSKTDTFIESPPNLTPRTKSEGDLWGKSQPTKPPPHAPPRGPPLDHWGANPHVAPPNPHIPAPDPYALPPNPRAPPPEAYSNDDGWSRRHPGYSPGAADAFTNRHASVNTDLHRSEQPGYGPEPYPNHAPQGPHPYEYQGGPQASYPQAGPPDPYPPAGPTDPYHPAGPPDSYPAVNQQGPYYPEPHARHPPPYGDAPPVGLVDPYGPPPTVGPRPLYHTPATIPTTTDDDPVIVPVIRTNAWYPTAHPPVGQHPPPYHTTPSPMTNFDPYPGYAPHPPKARPPPVYDAPLFNQYTIRYPDGSASKEEYTEVTSAVQRIVNYVYESTLREYKIADYFVMDRNTDSFAIRIAKDMCYVGTLDSAILDSFTEYTMKTRNATKAVLYSNNRLFFFKEIEQVLFSDVNTTRGGYIAGSCGDAFMFTVRMVKPRIIHMNDGSILPGSTCPYGPPLKDPRGKISSCKSGYCESRDHACHATRHICCPKMPTSTRCMSLSIGKFCVTYSPHNVIIN